MRLSRCRRVPVGTVLLLLLLGPLLGRASAEDLKTAERRERLAAQFDRGDRYALIVGVNRYADERMSPLRFCVADARLMAKVLVENCGYAASRVTLLADGEPAARLPTRENIQRHVSEMLLKTGPRDTVLVYFAGHGGIVRGATVLCPGDFNPENDGLTGVRIDHVRDLMHSAQAHQKLLVLDCCHSGTVRAGMQLGVSGEDLEGAKGAGGLITFAAARRTQSSQELEELGHGIFTLCLSRGLKGDADADKDGIVDSDEIYRFLHAEVEEMARERGHQQTPVRIIGEDVTGILALARVSGEAKVVREVKTGERARNSLGMELLLVLPGDFQRGSPHDEGERSDDEALLPVRVRRPYLLGATEVSQADYERVMGQNPSFYRPGGEGAEAVRDVVAARLPVEQVSWEDAMEFCRRLSALPEEKAAGRTYRLPTEAEWEFACRAGTSTPFSTGLRLTPTEANVDGTKPYLDAEEAPGLKRTAPVGSYAPNAWGFQDMHGNVAEWCMDWYGPNEPILSGQVDPAGPQGGTSRVVKGGSFLGKVAQARAAARIGRAPDFRHRTTGFRVVCILRN